MVRVSGVVRNMADALVLEGEAAVTLDLVCDRCLKPFRLEMRAAVNTLLAETLEDEENDDHRPHPGYGLQAPVRRGLQGPVREVRGQPQRRAVRL